jgi:hypothetical protein
MSDNPEFPQIDVTGGASKAPVQKGASAMKAHAKTAVRLAALSAEKARLTTVSLPSSFYELGKWCYQQRSFEADFVDLFAGVDQIAKALIANKKGAAGSPSPQPSFADRAKALAEQGMQAANAQKLGVQQRLALSRLGKAIYEKHGAQAGPENLTKAIEASIARLATVEQDLSKNLANAGGKKRVGWIAAGALCACVLVGSLVFDRSAGAGGKPVFFGPGNDVNTNKVIGRAFSKKQIAVLFKKAKALEMGMSEKQVVDALGQPTESSYTDYDKVEMSPLLKDGLKATVPTFNPNPSPLTAYAWTLKGDEQRSYIMVSIQDDRVNGIQVEEDGRITVERM